MAPSHFLLLGLAELPEVHEVNRFGLGAGSLPGFEELGFNTLQQPGAKSAVGNEASEAFGAARAFTVRQHFRELGLVEEHRLVHPDLEDVHAAAVQFILDTAEPVPRVRLAVVDDRNLNPVRFRDRWSGVQSLHRVEAGLPVLRVGESHPRGPCLVRCRCQELVQRSNVVLSESTVVGDLEVGPVLGFEPDQGALRIPHHVHDLIIPVLGEPLRFYDVAPHDGGEQRVRAAAHEHPLAQQSAPHLLHIECVQEARLRLQRIADPRVLSQHGPVASRRIALGEPFVEMPKAHSLS
mmetsp:Transcript_43489/g.102735  ORF Transcript_43489/g.102735 Transcript_43489/m.102735 type:complete len:294 (+) Transcript_43489:1031-1912(+)